jgi:hypothetical protein
MQDNPMGNRRLILAAAIVAVSVRSGFAGPCSSEISSIQARVDGALEALSANGSGAAENSEAWLHRQPTRRSIAAAEERLGIVSAKSLEGVVQAMARARVADEVGDRGDCCQALGEVKRLLGLP